MADASRESALEAALWKLYQDWARLPIPAGRKHPYYALRFRQMIAPGQRYRGGIEAVRHVLHKSKTEGFSRILEAGRPDLTVERAIVLSGQWDDIFSEDDRLAAQIKVQKSMA